jgi:hypothetical protein
VGHFLAIFVRVIREVTFKICRGASRGDKNII